MPRRMKWGFIGLILGLLLLPGAPVNNYVYAQNTQDFKIVSFVADYYLGRNEAKTATIRVVENIVAEFPTYDQNHGILRAIPKSYQGHTVNLEITGVTDETGQPHNYATYGEAGNLVLKIGDADRYVHGSQTYRITYTMKNVVAFFDDHEEFYWDINGDQWQQPFGMVMARVHIPADISPHLQPRQRCFTGSFGSTSEDCGIGHNAITSEQIVTFTASNLGPGETLTIVLGFNRGTFALGPEIQQEKQRKQLLLLMALGGIVLPPVMTGAWIYRRWRKYGKDPSGKGVIVPEYQPPKLLNALTSAAILEEQVPHKAVSALVVELAVKGYIRIHEIPKKGLLGKADYELEVVKDPSGLNDEEMRALRMFFSDGVITGAKVKLSSLKNKLHTEIGKLSEHVVERLADQGYFRADPHDVRRRHTIRGSILLFVGIFTGVLLGAILWSLAVGLALSGLLIIATAKIMPARTALGVNAREYLLGLKDYMQLAEEDRIKFLQSPAGAEKVAAEGDPHDPKLRVKLFEKLLPYAMLFGLEKDWAKQFQDVYVQPPDWYRGNWRTFNTVHLASSIGGFNTVSAASFTAPSSSGSSGFGGGGSSGGGGGGGGGGGW